MAVPRVPALVTEPHGLALWSEAPFTTALSWLGHVLFYLPPHCTTSQLEKLGRQLRFRATALVLFFLGAGWLGQLG